LQRCGRKYAVCLLAGDRLDMQMIGQCLKALDEKNQLLFKVDTHRTTNAATKSALPAGVQ